MEFLNKTLDKIMKLIVVGLLAVLIYTWLTSYSIACESKPTNFFYNNKQFKTGHMIYNDRMLVPLRTVSEQLGFKVSWNNKDKTIGITNDKDHSVFQLGNKDVLKFNINNIYDVSKIKMEVEPMIIDGRTFIPIRYAAESLGKHIRYYEDTKSRNIYITDYNPQQEIERR